MSCSSGGGAGDGGEASSALKYVVPGAVGALSLVLARRWGSVGGGGGGGGAQHAPQTGVSRRRRLAACRDPPLKRPPPRPPPPPHPPPPPPHSKLKKSLDDEAIRRRCTRSGAEATTQRGVNDESRSGVDSPRSPKHVPFPNVPHEHDVPFELMMFVFTALAAGAQFLNLYRTVWWLPHSYTNQTMNFYLIDCHLVLLILIVLGRRLLLSTCNALIRSISPASVVPILLQLISVLVLISIATISGWCIYNLFPKHSIMSMFFLVYPLFVYFIFFGLRITPLLQLESPGIRTPHCCANGAPAIRNEVEILKADFNYRLKQIIFSSLVGAYYASFIPWCFAQHFLHYDVFRIIRHLALVWLGLFTQHATYCFSARYCDQLHRSALHLGRWVRKNSASSISLTQNNSIISSGNSGFPVNNSTSVGTWCHKTLWAPGTSVKHGRWTYVSSGCVTAAEPGNLMHLRFYTLFHNPSNMLCALLCMQITLVMLLLAILLHTTEWHFILSLALLLFSNYYTLFKLIRDYLVTWKVYQTEFKIQEKNSVSTT